MISIGKDVYMFGGQGRTMFEELRMLDCSKKDQYNWLLLNEDDNMSYFSEHGKSVQNNSGEVADQPGPRTATVFCRYGHKLILYGGSGPYISHIKSRRCYYDIYEYDTVERRWFEDKSKIKG